MQAIILAAGFGTRLRPYTELRPKPLFPVLNRSLLEVHLATLTALGCHPIVVNAHHLSDQIEKVLQHWPGVFLQLEEEILGTGGSLRKALHVFENKPILVMNGDIFHNIDLNLLYYQHKQHTCPVSMAVHDHSRFNCMTVSRGLVNDFSCAPDTAGLAFTGIHITTPAVLERIPQGCFHHIIDLYAELAGQREIAALRVDGAYWHDMGTPEDYLDLHRYLLGRKKEKYRWLIDPTARLMPGVLLQGWGCIGKNVLVGKGAILKNAVVWDNAVIAPGQKYENAIVTGVDLEPSIHMEGRA
ncbi:sugar phosphate nucleotidyltransferase [Desulfogranum japonicum]|uniref:sugar phosphate nucleotidyltransferase n=1 Tax=Desulfogranum japonicum TaxID=231447 RepID=UPI000401AED3|nr:NDP-sugar synthase [Desulfogranum japonicum]